MVTRLIASLQRLYDRTPRARWRGAMKATRDQSATKKAQYQVERQTDAPDVGARVVQRVVLQHARASGLDIENINATLFNGRSRGGDA